MSGKSLEEFYEEHAISPEVGNARPYVRYEAGDVDLVGPYFEAYDSRVRRLASVVVGQSGGFLIVRHGFSRNGGRRAIPPQLRPDEAVYTSSEHLPSYHSLSPRARKYVYDRKKDGTVKRRSGKRVLVPRLQGAQLDRHLARRHGGKEFLTALGIDPADALADRERYATELEAMRAAVNVEGLHRWRPAAKYVLPSGEWGKALDVPPGAEGTLLRASRAFFVIEGSPKTDAILSTGEAAFGVPSVTLWRAGAKEDDSAPYELERFAQSRLRGKDVLIVPDADWITNPLVIAQAMFCREYLRDPRFGIRRVAVAAPPLANGKVERVGDVDRKGVDDHLALGGRLDEMVVIEREAPPLEVAWQALQMFRGARLSRAAFAVQRLALFADASGQLDKSIQSFARMLDCGWEKAAAIVSDLAEVGAIDVEGSLEAVERRGEDWFSYDWEERPRITLKSELRASQPEITLAEWSDPRPTVRTITNTTASPSLRRTSV